MKKILSVKDLHVTFNTYEGDVKAVRGVSFDLNQGETLAVVGESGSGKSVMSKSLMGLVPSPPGKIDDGEIYYKDINVLNLSKKGLRKLRGSKISMISQDPMSSLNPTMTVQNQIIEGIITHQNVSKKIAIQKAIELLELVGLKNAPERIKLYPHQFSGGMQQRVVIAMALACNPDILIADEPTTALDVTVQAQVLDLLKNIQKELGTSIIFITHDLGVVANIADRVAVMYAGKIVEIGNVKEIFYNPRHPYTIGLLKAMPNLDNPQNQLISIPGSPPNLLEPPEGDAFAGRNREALKIDSLYQPPMFQVSSTHYAATWLMHEKAEKNAKKFYQEQKIQLKQKSNNKVKEKKINSKKLIEIKDLQQHFKIGRNNVIKAVDGLTFDIFKGETFGLVGESGCGKSTTGRMLVQLYNPSSGKIMFKGKPINQYKKYDLNKKIQMIFQDPQSSLNPRWSVGDIISEGLNIHGMYSKEDRIKRVNELLEIVGLQKEHLSRYPHEFSGGQRQRIGIARALAVEPEFIVADEPISALDVSIQAQIVNLLDDLQKQNGLTYLFIAHDLSMVKHISDRIGVMYQGQIVEIATSDELYNNPLHDYTKTLLNSVPIPDPDIERQKSIIHKWENNDDLPSLKEVKKNHWVSCTEEEYKKLREKYSDETIIIT